MGNLSRKINRNRIKKALKTQGVNKEFPLSKYRFKTRDEILKEQANKIVDNMIRQESKK